MQSKLFAPLAPAAAPPSFDVAFGGAFEEVAACLEQAQEEFVPDAADATVLPDAAAPAANARLAAIDQKLLPAWRKDALEAGWPEASASAFVRSFEQAFEPVAEGERADSFIELYRAAGMAFPRLLKGAFTPMLGPSGGARFVDAELDKGMMRSVRQAKRDNLDLIAICMSDEDSHEDNEAINIESIIHAEAMRRSADDEDSSNDDESEADFDVEDDEEYHGPQSSDNSDGDGNKEGDVGKKSIKVKQQVGTEEGAEEVRGAA
eukprot:jgi/Chrpa1/7670/Chrysochromulina_OHIO_Genome00019074-RA